MFFKRTLKKENLSEKIKLITGVSPKNIHLYETAFTHRNYARKHNTENNETLEFVGDAVLSSIISEILYHKFPNQNEGMLTEMRSKIVNRKTLNNVGSKMGLTELIKVTEHQSVRENSHIVGNVLEALIGAVYIDRGYSKAQKFVSDTIITNYINIDELVNKVYSHKNLILNWAAQNGHSLVFEDKVINNRNQRKHFEVIIKNQDDEILGKSKAISKKEASQLASEVAIQKLKDNGLWEE